MKTIEDIEKALTELPADQLADFRAWFEAFDAARFDERIDQDANAGRLDRLAERAIAYFRAGRARELWGTSPVRPSGTLMERFRKGSER
jgi:hypothetical protein